jgi:CrcB protein
MGGGLLKKNLLVFIGAGLGGVARFGVGLLAGHVAPGPFPWGTFLINVSGCFAMGGLMYLFKERGVLTPHHRLFLMVGVLGGYTTFSSFGYESDALRRLGRPGLELAYVGSSAVFGLAAVWAGRVLAKALDRALRPAPRPQPEPQVPGALPLEEELSE